MVGVAGLEPAASWSRTMRDTKLRHTPLAVTIIMKEMSNVKCFAAFFPMRNFYVCLPHRTV